jgi:hypothetical protein
MLINEGTYLINSLGEKYIYSDKFVLKWLDKSGFKSLMAKAFTSSHDTDDEDEGEGGNG